MNPLAHIWKALWLVIVLGVPASMVRAQPAVTLRGGNQTITITTGVAGGQPTPVINTTTRMDYRRRLVPTKITVSTICPGQSFTLKVLATGVPVGIPAPEVTLVSGMIATDFITGIPAGTSVRQRCRLRYTASSTFSQGNSTEFGNDVHTVTYTMVAQ